MFIPTGTTDQDAYLGGVHSPDGTGGDSEEGVTSISTQKALDKLKDQGNQAQEDQDVKIIDVEKDEEVRCMNCMVCIGGENVLQCRVCHSWVWRPP